MKKYLILLKENIIMEKRKFENPIDEAQYWNDPKIKMDQPKRQIIEGGIEKAYFPSKIGSLIAILGAIIIILSMIYLIGWIAINIKSLIFG